MTSHAADSLRLLQVLARAAGATGRPIHADVQAVEYDWNAPSHFSTENLAKLGELAATLAQGLSQALGRHLQKDDIELRPQPVAQAFAGHLNEQLGQAEAYRLTLAADDDAGGAMMLDVQTAFGWIARLLGGREGGGARELSDLEADLLADTAAILLQVVSDAFQQSGARPISQSGGIAKDPAGLPASDDAEYCDFAFAMGDLDQMPIRLAVPCEWLDAVVGAGDADQADHAGGISPEAARSAMIEHFGRLPIEAVALAGNTELTMRDVMGLEVGDVLLLPKHLDDPIELNVAGRTVLVGYAVACSGHYGIEVCEVPTAGDADPTQPQPQRGNHGSKKG